MKMRILIIMLLICQASLTLASQDNRRNKLSITIPSESSPKVEESPYKPVNNQPNPIVASWISQEPFLLPAAPVLTRQDSNNKSSIMLTAPPALRRYNISYTQLPTIKSYVIEPKSPLVKGPTKEELSQKAAHIFRERLHIIAAQLEMLIPHVCLDHETISLTLDRTLTDGIKRDLTAAQQIEMKELLQKSKKDLMIEVTNHATQVMTANMAGMQR